ncbi:hypothetical protein JVT61DRAFT_8871 [Boletus reticuloceps]|uniref:Uncharacterized protein n=1 Tax=Boletus reticuloceps TaxID=495285 RepID=A0A8I3A539_9AGAM|nr:hypothetical protein JVT61DRAFT_8871 [Boletus reticuloceps]
MTIICDLWFLEIRDARFSPWDNNQRGSPIFSTEIRLIAKVSLYHLEDEISHGDELDLLCITCDSQLENIRLALMRQGVIKVTAEILALIVHRKWEANTQMFARRSIADAAALLRSRIEEMDALPFLSQALERGLVASLLKCEASLTSAVQPSARQEPILLLAEVLPGYSVYRSVLHQLTLAVDSAIAQGLDAKLSKSGGFCVAWKRLKDAVDE